MRGWNAFFSSKPVFLFSYRQLLELNRSAVHRWIKRVLKMTCRWHNSRFDDCVSCPDKVIPTFHLTTPFLLHDNLILIMTSHFESTEPAPHEATSCCALRVILADCEYQQQVHAQHQLLLLSINSSASHGDGCHQHCSLQAR